MPIVKLSYFDFPGGRGEDCRLALHIAGIEFEDNRVQFQDWPGMKPTTPFGALPVLEVQGKRPVAQSNAILELIGRQHGLLPDDPFEAARHVAVLNVVEEIRGTALATSEIKDEQQKKAAREKLASGRLKHWCQNMENQIDGPFVGGEQISVADLKLYVFMGFIKSGKFDHVPASYFGPCAQLETLYGAVAAHPQVAGWQARFSPES